MEYWRVPVHVPNAVAVTVKVKVPAAVGVPLSKPAVVKVNPVGKEPTVTVKL